VGVWGGGSGGFLAAAVNSLWFQQWLLPFLLAPAFVAGALAEERANGMLPLLFTTPLRAGEILLGKFLGRIFPLLLLCLVHWPFWGVLTALVGFDPLSAAVLAAAPLLPMLAAGAVSLLALVWCRKSFDALVALYILFGVGIPGIWIGSAVASSIAPGNVWLMVLETGLAPFGPEYLLEHIWHCQGALPELCRHVLKASVAWGS